MNEYASHPAGPSPRQQQQQQPPHRGRGAGGMASAGNSGSPREAHQVDFDNLCGAEELDLVNEYELDPAHYEDQRATASTNKNKKSAKAELTAEEEAFMLEAMAEMER
jgi:hypothetical protein